MKTRERILQTSLALFNQLGERHVTTNHIADEMDISPGNLYYHFKNKDQIITILFQRFEVQMKDALEVPQRRALNMEDMWLYLHLIFENIWRYRFLYRDLNNLLHRNRELRRPFTRLLNRKITTATAICEGLIEAGVMHASRDEVKALTHNITLIATYWLNLQGILSKDAADPDRHLGQGVYQVMAAVTPFMVGDARTLLSRLSHDYLD